MHHTLMAKFKNIGLALVLILGFSACEKDLQDIAVDIVDKNDFSVGDSLINIIAYNANIDSSRVDNNNAEKKPLPLIGVNRNNNFGYMQSAISTQLFLPVTGVHFGENTIIDRVVLDIPYFATRDAEDQEAIDPDTGNPIFDEDGNPIMVPSFQIDSIYGNKSQAFNISVHELGTFLNVLDPENPTQSLKYYSDKVYQLKDELFSGNFLPNRNDTVLYVERRYLDDDPNTVDDIDTVKILNSQPTMKFDLDKQYFKTHFVDHQDSDDFLSIDNFIHYFRGLYIDAQGADGSLINPQFSQASVTIYFTDDQTVEEGPDEDLNNNGVEDEGEVIARTKQSMVFPISGVSTANYTRDYSGALVQNYLLNPDRTNGEDKLFIQGAAGSEIIIELFKDNLDYFRNKNWLINEANIVLSVDGDQEEVPQRLFLYKKETNSQIIDFKFGDPSVYDGYIQYDEDGKPKNYKIRITDYISKVLHPTDPIEPQKLAIRNYLATDLPDAPVIDTIVPDYNFIPKGVVIKGSLPIVGEDKIRLEIKYSELNEEN